MKAFIWERLEAMWDTLWFFIHWKDDLEVTLSHLVHWKGTLWCFIYRKNPLETVLSSFMHWKGNLEGI